MTLTNWLRSRTANTTPRPARRPRTRLGVEAMEDRTVPASLGQIGGVGTELLDAQVMDAAGNVYLAGTFDQVADFDPGPGTTPWMVPQGSGSDEFVAKYTPAGAIVWAKRFGGSAGDGPVRGLAVDAAGNAYVTGWFTGTADFGGRSLAATNSNGNAYVLKLDAATGGTAWVSGAGGAGRSAAWGVAVDGDAVYCSGFFDGQADFDRTASYADNHDVLKSAGTGKTPPADALIWRLRTDGAFVSAWGIGGTGTEDARGIAAANGTVYLHGNFSGTADFDPSPTAAVTRTSVSGRDLFLASYTPIGSSLRVNWVHTMSTLDTTTTTWMTPSGKIALDATSLYLPGQYRMTVDFDRNNGVSDARDTLTSVAGSGDVFVAKYNLANGSLAWVRGVGGPGSESGGSSVAVTDTGMVYVGGVFSQTVDFDPAHPNTDNREVLTSKRSVDGFNLQLDANGAFVNAWRMGGAGYDTSRVIGVCGGRLYSAGAFEQTADFPTGGTLTSFGASGLFLQALDSFTANPSPATVGNPVTLTASNVTAATPGGTITQVAFYIDSNGDAKLDPATDTLLGYGTQTGTGTWAFAFTFTTAGTYKLFAQAKDSYGVLSDPLTLDLEVV